MGLVFSFLTFSSRPSYAADWEQAVSQLVAQHGFQLPPAQEERTLRALEIGAGANPVSRDQFNLDFYETSHPGVHLPNMIDADANQVPLPANSLDVIFAHNVPEMFSPQAFVTEADRLLRPGGVFIVIGDIHGELESLEWRLVHYTKSTIAAHAMGYDMIDVQPGALTLPNAPKVHGFALKNPRIRSKPKPMLKIRNGNFPRFRKLGCGTVSSAPRIW